MRTQPPPVVFEGHRPDANANVRVVIVYANQTTAAKAMEAYQRLTAQCGTEFVFRLSVWRFDVFQDATLSRMAVADAAAADVILLAAESDRGLPEPLKAWIESWASFKAGQAALLAVLLEGSSESASNDPNILEFLTSVTKRAGLDFLAQESVSVKTGEGPTPAKRAVAWRRENLERPATDGWGINE